jgi:PAS domain S-box-containing protein
MLMQTSKRDLRLIAVFCLTTLLATWIVIIGWEKLLRGPFYTWVEARYPRHRHFEIEQRTEHFLISAAVYAIVVVFLLRMVKQQQRGLVQSEKRYRSLFEHASDGIGIVDLQDFRFLKANKTLTEMLGFSAEELCAKDFCWLLSAERICTRASIEEMLQTPAGRELTLRTATGPRVPVWVSFSTFDLDERKLITMIVRDLSELKRNEETLKKLSSAVEQAADTICVTDTEGVIEYVNPAFEELSGFSRDETIGKTFSILRSGAHPDALYKELWATILAGEVFQGTLINRRKNGEVYYEERTIKPLKDASGKTTHFVSTGKDITTRKQAEEALRESELRYRLLFDNSPLPMWVYDDETLRFLAVNEAAIVHYGYTREEFLAMTILAVRPPEDEAILREALASPGQGAARGLFRHRKKDGSVIMVEISAHPLTFDGRAAHCVQPHDVTERLRLESEKQQMQAQLFQSSKLASIGELSAGVAHEISNPINSVINFGQLLKDDGVATDPFHQRIVDGIIEEGGRVAKIVHGLLTLAQRDSRELDHVDIGEIISSSLGLFGRQLEEEGVTVHVDVAENLAPVAAQGSLLRQAMVNLISNARHALAAKSDCARILRISGRELVRDGASVAEIEFFDNGVGIPPEHLDNVFDPFFTTRRNNGGAGLGLSLSLNIIRNYGGNLTVQSEHGAYTRFRIELPLSQCAQQECA